MVSQASYLEAFSRYHNSKHRELQSAMQTQMMEFLEEVAKETEKGIS